MAARNLGFHALARVGIGTWLTTAAFAGLAVMLFAAAMTAAIDYDEEQYVAGAYFAQDLELYRDFISLQPPPYTWLMARVFEISGGWYLLTARVVTWVFAFACCWLLYSVLRSMRCDRVAALLLLGAFTASPFLQGPLVETRNDIQPLFLMLAGLRLFLGHDGAITNDKYRVAASGLLFSLAAATKYSYLFAAPIAAAALLYDARRAAGSRADPRVGWFVAGALVGALPVFHALYTQRDRFTLLTLQFHGAATLDWYQRNGRGEMLTMAYKLAQLPRLFVREGNGTLAIVGAAAFGALALGKRRRSTLRDAAAEPTSVALVALTIGALVIALVVGPHLMYYAPVGALLAVVAGRLVALAEPGMSRWMFAALVIVSVLPALPAVERYGRAVLLSVDVEQWTGVQAHRSAARIARVLAERGIAGDVATLFPIVALDANSVRPEFAAGPFFFRSAYLYTTDDLFRLHGAGAATLDRLFAAAPPAAIVGGFRRFRLFNDMDAPLLAYAQRTGYTLAIEGLKVRGYSNGQVWIRPAER